MTKKLLPILLLCTAVYGQTGRNYTAMYVNDPQFSTYLNSDLGQTMGADMDREIAGYFHDLSTTVSDLYDLDIILPLKRFDLADAVFLYEHQAENPQYHLRQNYAQPLGTVVDSHYLGRSLLNPTVTFGSMKLFFQLRSAEECSDLRIVVGDGSEAIENHFVYMSVADDQVELQINSFQMRDNFEIGDSFSLEIPDGCLVSLTSVERKLYTAQHKQLLYSHRNNRRPELRGLESNRIDNFDEFNFFTSMTDFVWVPLEEYNDTDAKFVWRPELYPNPYVIPQNFTLTLHHARTPWVTLRGHNVAVMTLQSQNGEACLPGDENSPGYSIRRIDPRTSEVMFDKSLLHEPLSLQTYPDCELVIVKISRAISLSSNPILQKQMRHGMTPNIFRQSHITLAGDYIGSPVVWNQYVETLEDFPSLPLKSASKFGSPTVFCNTMEDRYVVPKAFPLVLHTAVESRRIDFVTFTFRKSSPDCQIVLYKRLHGEQYVFKSRLGGGLSRAIKGDEIKITYAKHRLNTKFTVGTEFFFISTCDLSVDKITRKVDGLYPAMITLD